MMVSLVSCLIQAFMWLCIVQLLIADDTIEYSGTKKSSTQCGIVPETSRMKRSLIFPSGSIMQFSWGIGVNPNVDDASININFGFQQNVPLPTNITQLRQVPGERSARKMNPARLYHFMENQLERYGFHGTECLKKSICEMASTYFHGDGVFENIIAHILTPSLHTTWDWPQVHWLEAEHFGSTGGDCFLRFPGCPVSPFYLFTTSNNLNNEW